MIKQFKISIQICLLFLLSSSVFASFLYVSPTQTGFLNGPYIGINAGYRYGKRKPRYYFGSYLYPSTVLKDKQNNFVANVELGYQRTLLNILYLGWEMGAGVPISSQKDSRFFYTLSLVGHIKLKTHSKYFGYMDVHPGIVLFHHLVIYGLFGLGVEKYYVKIHNLEPIVAYVINTSHNFSPLVQRLGVGAKFVFKNGLGIGLRFVRLRFPKMRLDNDLALTNGSHNSFSIRPRKNEIDANISYIFNKNNSYKFFHRDNSSKGFDISGPYVGITGGMLFGKNHTNLLEKPHHVMPVEIFKGDKKTLGIATINLGYGQAFLIKRSSYGLPYLGAEIGLGRGFRQQKVILGNPDDPYVGLFSFTTQSRWFGYADILPGIVLFHHILLYGRLGFGVEQYNISFITIYRKPPTPPNPVPVVDQFMVKGNFSSRIFRMGGGIKYIFTNGLGIGVNFIHMNFSKILLYEGANTPLAGFLQSRMEPRKNEISLTLSYTFGHKYSQIPRTLVD